MNTTLTSQDQTCPYCGGWHNGRCPSVKAIEYFPDGRVKRIEFVTGETAAQSLPIIPEECASILGRTI